MAGKGRGYLATDTVTTNPAPQWKPGTRPVMMAYNNISAIMQNGGTLLVTSASTSNHKKHIKTLCCRKWSWENRTQQIHLIFLTATFSVTNVTGVLLGMPQHYCHFSYIMIAFVLYLIYTTYKNATLPVIVMAHRIVTLLI